MDTKAYARQLRYLRTPRGRFIKQRQHARRRGVEWRLTFEEWLHVWRASGNFEQRGRGDHQFCMARIGDSGPYEVGNVEIQTMKQNRSDAWPWHREKERALAEIAIAL